MTGKSGGVTISLIYLLNKGNSDPPSRLTSIDVRKNRTCKNSPRLYNLMTPRYEVL